MSIFIISPRHLAFTFITYYMTALHKVSRLLIFADIIIVATYSIVCIQHYFDEAAARL